MTTRVVIIGGDAAGATAAARIAAAQRDDLELVVLERTPFTSYSACGIPMLIGGEIPDGPDALVARTPGEHRRRGVDVRTRVEARAIDLDRQQVEAADLETGSTLTFGFDELLIATGGTPIRPPLPGIDLPFVRGVQTLQDGIDLLRLADQGCRRTVIVGGGYIGVEIAEAFANRGCTSILVERAPSVLTLLDHDLATQVVDQLGRCGVDVRLETDLDGLSDGVVHTSGGDVPADLVVMAIGVAPNSSLADAAGIELGAKGAIAVDRRQATTTSGVWAAGDCAESTHLLTDEQVHIALGTVANKAGRTAGLNIAGGDHLTPKVLGTAITRVGPLEVALTGLTHARATEAGFEARDTTIEATTHAGYLPSAEPMTVRLTVEEGSGRVLGAQIVGGRGAAMRIDTVVAAITAGMTATELSELDLAYAPPFSSVWDPIAVAGRQAASARRGE